ncbi:MAG: hypothetical protein O2917_09735 [Acidobacteria bacterium]|nr:hypothetical protein [Acidobacteriota bacterium]
MLSGIVKCPSSCGRLRIGFCGVLVGLWAIGVAAQQAPPAQERPGQPADITEDLRVRFKVTVTAEQTVLARVREFLELVATRNTALNRFAQRHSGATTPELELVLLFEPHPRMPWGRRDLGSVYLRMDPEADTAAVEYCIRRCTEKDADVAAYHTTLDEFLQKLDTTSAALARRWR